MSDRFKHQATVFDLTKDMPAYAYHWEVRCGKTYPNLDTVYYNAANKKIDTVIVWTTNGNHIKWADKHIPNYIKEMGDSFNSKIVVWESKKYPEDSEAYKNLIKECAAHPGLLWICVNFEALPLDRLESFIEKIVKLRKCFLITDEAHWLKTPSASRTKAALRMSRGTLFRRNLTGSPAPKNAFDLWSQYQLLDPKIFDMKFTTFKATYGIWKRMKFGARSFDMLDVDQGERGFKNLDQLYEITKPYTSRLLRADVFENLPKNVPYQCRFDLSEKQEKAIQDLKNEMMTVLDSGEVITTQFAIVQIMRVQQIARGFVGQTGKEVIDLGGPYPALEALTEEMDKLLFDLRLNRKIIIWARFTADVDMIIKHLTKEGYGECVRYDGQVKPQQREENVHRFQTDPKVRVLVGNPAARTEGQDMTAGYGMIYYSYSYDLLEREQSTGRNHGVNQKEMSLPVIDMVANRTWDDIILENLAGKKDLGAIITGDKFRKMVEAL